MREFKRIYYTANLDSSVLAFTDNSGTGDIIECADAVAGTQIGNFIVCRNIVGEITSEAGEGGGTYHTFTYNIVGTPEDKGSPVELDRVYVISATDYIEGFMNRQVITENAFFSDVYNVYNQITTETISFESNKVYNFLESGSTLGSYDVVKAVAASQVMVLADCDNNSAQKIVYNDNGRGRVVNKRVKHLISARVIA